MKINKKGADVLTEWIIIAAIVLIAAAVILGFFGGTAKKARIAFEKEMDSLSSEDDEVLE